MKNLNIPQQKLQKRKRINNLNLPVCIQDDLLADFIPAGAEKLPEILFITSYPPRECGIATYSQDLITSLKNKFGTSFDIKICALENGTDTHQYIDDVISVLDTSNSQAFSDIAASINKDKVIKLVLIQHEFGFFRKEETVFVDFLNKINKPIVVVFHTVLPNPDEKLKILVQNIVNAAGAIVVMTQHAANLLQKDYLIDESYITVIAHGTHLVPHINKNLLKEKYHLTGRKVLTTFGLLSSGKSIETTLKALPEIIKVHPDVIFLVIGKTHPEVVKHDNENYRQMLKTLVEELRLEEHVRFINDFVELHTLLEYLQLTDIYLFTTNDPNQAVSGTFVYAMSCGCPIISTPIPHAKEVLTTETGIVIGFQDSAKLSESVNLLFKDDVLRENMSTSTLQKIVFTAWENSAVEHARLFNKLAGKSIRVKYIIPEIVLDHLQKMTTGRGLIQFSKINQPDLSSGYTLDDNARALIAMCMYFEMTPNDEYLRLIETYLHYIKSCIQPDGNLLNYMDAEGSFTNQNYETNLDDANGRSIWALGFLISKKDILPVEMVSTALSIFNLTLPHIETIHSTRAIAFIIKGLYYYDKVIHSRNIKILTGRLAERLTNMYLHESTKNWEWYESYLTYANSIIPEAMLCAAIMLENKLYEGIAIESFTFLLNMIFNENGIEVVTNKSRFCKGDEPAKFGEQPIDVAYTVMTLNMFYEKLGKKEYSDKMTLAFNWFLGENRLNQIIYNPCTGGCYDGLEENNVNLNQGAESTVSYLLARLTIDKYIDPKKHYIT